jgi:hypothetical protein
MTYDQEQDAADISELEEELAVALAEVEGLRSGLAFYKPEAERYRAVLKTIQGWDCLNPPQADLCADFPWLRRLVDMALEPDPTARGAEFAFRMPLDVREGAKSATATEVPATPETGAP